MHPEYPCAHCIVAQAVSTVLQSAGGDVAGEITLASPTAPGVTRKWTRLQDYSDEVSNARIYAGFHYRSTLVRSNTLGIAVAKWVNDNMMTPLPERPLGPDDKDNDGHYVGISVQESYDVNKLENED